MSVALKGLPFFSLVRLSAIVFLVSLRSVDVYTYANFYYAVLCSHFLWSFYYSRRQLASLPKRTELLGWTASGIAFAVFTVWSFFPPMVLYFAIHHAFSEGYMVSQTYPDAKSEKSNKFLLVSRIYLTVAGYLLLLRSEKPLDLFPIVGLQVFFALACACFALALLVSNKGLAKKGLLDTGLFEIIGIVSVFIFSGRLYFIDIVFYHLLVWVILPLKKEGNNNKGKFSNYMVQTAVSAAGFLLITPMSGLFPAITYEHLSRVTTGIGYWHITLTFFISRYNPQFLVKRFFAPKGTPYRTLPFRLPKPILNWRRSSDG